MHLLLKAIAIYTNKKVCYYAQNNNKSYNFLPIGLDQLVCKFFKKYKLDKFIALCIWSKCLFKNK